METMAILDWILMAILFFSLYSTRPIDGERTGL